MHYTATITYAWIVRPDGKISTGGRRPNFTKKGKIYSLTNLKKHFAMFTGPVNRSGFRPDALLETYEGCNLIVEDYQFHTSSGLSPDMITYELCKHHPSIQMISKETQTFPTLPELASVLLWSRKEQEGLSSIVLKYCLTGIQFNSAERDFSYRLEQYIADLRELMVTIIDNELSIEDELVRLENLTPEDPDWATREKDWKALKKRIGKLPN